MQIVDFSHLNEGYYVMYSIATKIFDVLYKKKKVKRGNNIRGHNSDD